MHGQRGPSCFLGECLTLTVRWSCSWLLSLPPGTIPNCISQQEGWRAISLLASPRAFPLEEYSSVATTPLYTSLSGRRGETQDSLHLNHRGSLEKRSSTSSPGCVKKSRDQTAQARPGVRWKAQQVEEYPLLGHREVPTCWVSPRVRGALAAWSCGHLNFNFDN